MQSSSAFRSLALAGAFLAGGAFLAPGASAQQRNCIDTLAGMPDYSRLVGAVSLSHMVNDLRTAQNVTVFAPTNAAIAAVDPNLVNRIFPQDESGMRQADPVLAAAAIRAHVVSGRIPAAALTEGLQLATAAGTSVQIGNTPGAERGITVTATEGVTARVVQRDVPCSNGVIHGIDRVLIR